MNQTVNRRYIFVISALAVGVLVVGAILKPKKAVPDPPSPSEMASLQARVRRDELGETASFFAQRAQMLAQNVVYDREHDSSGVAWEKGGQVLTTRGSGLDSYEPPLILRHGQGGKPPSTRSSTLNPGHWLLVVGRTADSQLIWEPVLYGGTRQTKCSGQPYSELIVNARFDGALAGAGAFDLDGVLAGVVANCDGNYHLVSAASIPSLLKDFATPDRSIDTLYGFRVTEMNDDAKRLFSLESGLFVKEVRQGDTADLAGLSAGDVIKAVKGQPLSRVHELWSAFESEDQNSRVLEVLRNARSIGVRMPSIAEAGRTVLVEESLGMRILPSTRVTQSIYVSPGTPAYKAGLRTGDLLIRAGDGLASGSTDLSRAVSRMGDKPLLVVYQRGRVQQAALVTK